MAQTYKETLTELRDNIADIQDALNDLGCDGSEPMDTWADQLGDIKDQIDSLEDQVSADDADFSDIYDAIVQKGQSPDEEDRDTYAPAILAITTGGVLDTLQVTPSTSSQRITPPSGVDGYNVVEVDAVTAAIDPDIVAGNIKKNVDILGVVGTYEPDLQAKSVTPSTSQQVVEPDQNKDGLSSVTVGAVTAAIDNNIQAGNIKDGITILGVLGTYAGGGGGNYQAKTATPSASQQVITPDQGYDALSSVTIDGDADLIPGNIKNGVTIFGVLGTYSGGGGGISFTDLRYFCYKNSRQPSAVWSLVEDNDANCTNFEHMCEDATFTAGTYELDISNISNRDYLNDMLKSIEVSGVSNLTILIGSSLSSLYKLFDGMDNASTQNYMNLTIANKGNSNSINFLREAFYDCVFGTLDISDIAGGSYSGYESLYKAFYKCRVLTDLVGIDSLNTSNVTEMNEMFREFNIDYNNAAFDTLDASGWDLSNIQKMNQFCDNSRLKHVVFGASHVFDNVSFISAFSYCSQLIDIVNMNIQESDVSTRENRPFQAMFRDCPNLVEVAAQSDWEIHSGLHETFSGCSSLQDLPTINIYLHDAGWKDSLEYCFYHCTSLQNITINIDLTYSNGHELYVTNMFDGCSSLEYVDGDFNLSQVNNLNNVFAGCTSLICIETSGGIAENKNEDMTLDLSASPVFDIDTYLDNLATKVTSYTRNIKLHSTVYSNLTAATIAKAQTKGYNLTT